MLVDRYQVKIPEVTSTGTTINIPIDMKFQMVDQSDIIKRDFVNTEVEAAINPIFDYEKVRFKAARNVSATFAAQVPNVVYKLNFLDQNQTYYQALENNVLVDKTHYDDIGFTNDDIKFRKNGLIKSILRLEFYDSDILTNQRLLFFLTIRPKVNINDVTPPSTNLPFTQIYSASRKRVHFNLTDTTLNPDGYSEGYNLYSYKDEVDFNLPKEIYMRAIFNNAKTGIRTRFMKEYDPQNIAWPIDQFITKIHTKYVLHRSNSGYFYEIDSSNTNVNLIDNNNTYEVNLYEVAVI